MEESAPAVREASNWLPAESPTFDAAAVYSVTYRGWQTVASVVTLVFLGRFLSPVEQGVYFTFASLIAFQVVAELGLTYVAIQFASHEMAALRWTPGGILTGSPVAKERIRALTLFSVQWCTVGAVLLALVFIPLGWQLLSIRPEVAEAGSWRSAWVWLVLSTAGSMALAPLLAILEGCNRVADVARFRTWQDFVAYGCFWTTLAMGGGLLAYPVLQAVRFIMSLWWLTNATRSAWSDLARTPASTGGMNWRDEIWPMQWRIALSWLAGFSVFQLFSPIAFALLGAIDAGRLGMTVAATSGITTVAVTLVSARAPVFGGLIAQRRYAELDALFGRTLRVALLLAGSAGVCLWGIVILLEQLGVAWRFRVLGSFEVALLALVAVVNALIFSLAIYLRAHKQEPLVANSVAGAVLTPIVLYVGAVSYGITGMVVGYCLLTCTAGLAWGSVIFIKKRRAWHQEQRA